MNEADTCRKLIVPRLQASGWDNEPHSIAEQRTITDGRIVPVGKGFVRKPPKREDYLLRFGFERIAGTEMIDDLAGTFTADYLRAHPGELARIDPLRLDISRVGVIER